MIDAEATHKQALADAKGLTRELLEYTCAHAVTSLHVVRDRLQQAFREIGELKVEVATLTEAFDLEELLARFAAEGALDFNGVHFSKLNGRVRIASIYKEVLERKVAGQIERQAQRIRYLEAALAKTKETP